MGSNWTARSLYIGYSGTGALTIQGGGQVICSGPGYVGHFAGSAGTTTVAGIDSAWTNSGALYVGGTGRGTLRVLAGGLVSNGTGYIGFALGTTGTVNATGAGSRWDNGGDLYIGFKGSGCLLTGDDAAVSARSLTVSNTKSFVSMYVSGNDMLVLGNLTKTGSITNKGTINLYSDAFLAAGSYTPISEIAGRAMTWSGTGAYSAYGGTWSSTAHTVAVVAPTALPAGAVDPIGSGERMLFADAVSGGRAGASFGTVSGGMTFSATVMTNAEVGLLRSATGFVGQVLSGWDFTTNLTGSQVMLSFDVGLGLQDVLVWHLVGSTWSQYTPDLMTYDSHGIVSFTVSSFSGYAVTADASIPGDTNRDGIVDQADYTVWYNNYGACGGWTKGDFNGDNLVDQADYTIWYNNYGSSGGSVPEPATLMLLAVASAAVVRRRRLHGILAPPKRRGRTCS